MRAIRATSYSELRRNLATELDRVAADHEPLIITRGRGKAAAVLISLEDLGSHAETEYLLRSPANAKELRESIAEIERGGRDRARAHRARLTAEVPWMNQYGHVKVVA